MTSLITTKFNTFVIQSCDDDIRGGVHKDEIMEQCDSCDDIDTGQDDDIDSDLGTKMPSI